jgi:hypothetical protein
MRAEMRPLARLALRPEPARLAVQRAEGDRQHGAFRQRARTAVADDGQARRGEVHLLPPAGSAAVGQAEDAPAIGALQRAGQQQADGREREKRLDRRRPASSVVGGRGAVVVRAQGRQVVHLVHHEQVPVAAELGEMQVGRRGDALVGGDVAREAAAGIGRVLGGADREGWPSAARQPGSAKASSACRRRLSRGTTQQTRSQTPASMSAWAASTGSSDLPPPGVTAARMSRVPEASLAAMDRTTASVSAWWLRRRRATNGRRLVEVRRRILIRHGIRVEPP